MRKSLIQKLWFLALWCLVSFATQLVVVKIVTEKYGFGFNGNQFVLFTSQIAVLFNLGLVLTMGWVDKDRLRHEYKRFLPSGFCAAAVVVCGLLVLNFKNLNALTANALYKGTLIPIAFAVSLMYGHYSFVHDKGKAWQKAIAWPQLVAFLLALVAVATAVIGSVESGFNLFNHWFPPCVLLMYALSYAPRLWFMKTQTGSQLSYFGTEHVVTCVFVTLFNVFVHLVPLTMLPSTIVEIVQNMRFTKEILRPEIWKLGLVGGISFALYAPASMLILMYDQGSKGTVAYGSILHKTIGLAAAILSTCLLVLFVPMWFSGQKVKWPNGTEIISFSVFCAATFIPMATEHIDWLRRFGLFFSSTSCLSFKKQN